VIAVVPIGAAPIVLHARSSLDARSTYRMTNFSSSHRSRASFNRKNSSPTMSRSHRDKNVDHLPTKISYRSTSRALVDRCRSSVDRCRL
jgi:hypothetical protein